MKPFPVAILVGIAFSSGMLVPLVGLHATDDFQRLPPVGALIWGNQTRTAEANEAAAAPADELAYIADSETEQRAALAQVATPFTPTATPAELDVIHTVPTAIQASAPDAGEDAGLATTAPGSGTALADSFSSADIADIQTLLKIRGYDPGPIDGRMGPGTARAIREFEQAENLPVTGSASPKLVAALSAANDGVQTADTQTASTEAASDTEVAPQALQASSNGPLRLVP